MVADPPHANATTITDTPVVTDGGLINSVFFFILRKSTLSAAWSSSLWLILLGKLQTKFGGEHDTDNTVHLALLEKKKTLVSENKCQISGTAHLQGYQPGYTTRDILKCSERLLLIVRILTFVPVYLQKKTCMN